MSETKYPEAPIDYQSNCPKCGCKEIRVKFLPPMSKELTKQYCSNCKFERILWQRKDITLDFEGDKAIAKRLQEADWFEWQYWSKYKDIENQKITNQQTMMKHQKEQISKLQSDLAHKTEMIESFKNSGRWKSW